MKHRLVVDNSNEKLGDMEWNVSFVGLMCCCCCCCMHSARVDGYIYSGVCLLREIGPKMSLQYQL